MLPLPDGARSALVIVDMQEFFFHKVERRQNLKAIIANINLLIDHFEARNMPIFHVISVYQADGSNWDLKMRAAGEPELIEGSRDAAILPQIKLSKEHTIIKKTRYSAFFKTDLAERLQGAGVQRVIVVGAYTHYCVNSTVFDAYCHDFVPGIINDAVSSHLKTEADLMVARMRRNGYHVFTTAEFLQEGP